MINKTILILDGEQRSALAATRSLGKAGAKIITGSELGSSLSGASKYCHQQIRYSSPYEKPDVFINEIKDIIQKEKIDILFPMTDISVFTILSDEEEFKKITILPCVPFEKYLKASDKVLLAKMAIKMGVPVPQTIFIDKPHGIIACKSEIKYPVVLKPHASLIHGSNKIFKCGVHIIHSFDQLENMVNKHVAFSRPFMIQEKIKGDGIGIFALFDHGKPVAVFSHRRIREKPPWGGVSVLSESTKPDPDAKEFALRILKALDWHGVAMVEFKRDNSKNGLPVLMEINARFWGSLQLSVDSGIDFPLLLVSQYMGEKIKLVNNYKYSRLRWLLGDIDNLYITLKQSGKHVMEDSSMLTKLSAIKKFILEFSKKSKFEILRKDDLKPFLWEFKNYF